MRSFAAMLAMTLGVAATAAPEPPAASSAPAAASAPAAKTPAVAPAPGANTPAAASVPEALAPAAQAPEQPPLAQPGARPVTPPAPAVMPAAPAVGSLLQTTLALVFVLALLAGLAWFLKRYGPKAGGGNAHLRVVGALSLGGRERIMVVEVGDQWIVVGASPGRVNALATMPKQPGVEPSAVLAAHLPPAAGFADWLKQTIDKRNAK